MKWMTSPHIHFDRVISAWLILRFVDPQATFEFANGLPEDSDTVAFGIRGAALGPHDESGSTFGKIIDSYALDDPALRRLRSLVDATVKTALDGTISAETWPVDPLLALAEGIMLESTDDASCLSNSLDLYDAIYSGISLRLAASAARPGATVRDCTFDITGMAPRCRANGGHRSGSLEQMLIEQVRG